MARKQRKITSGGVSQQNIRDNYTRLDIVLQAPELFHFDIRSYISSLNSAKAIDSYTRSRLYDLYESSLLDLHLTGVINKRLVGVSRIPIEFRRDGAPDEAVNEHLRSPWFRKFVKDVLWSKFWGFSLFQFYKEGDWIGYDLVDRKHYDPVRREILRYETDNSGIPIEEFSNMLYVGDDPRDLGLLSKIVPIVLYKRGNMGDWAQFCQIFGIPIREYTYDAGDEQARQRLIKEARTQGANAVYIHPKDSTLNLIEAGNKSGTVDLYERFTDACNTEISIAVLGSTLTTDSKSNGTQALGTVHQEEENQLKEDDRDFILDVLNFHMTDIFNALGVDTKGGQFTYVKSKDIKKSEQITIVRELSSMGLPISDDYLYETFEIDRPEDYDARKKAIAEKEEEKRLLAEQLSQRLNAPEGKDKPASFKNRLQDFFEVAPQDGAARH
ncbi:MAG: phage portal protein family protein [Candidatus Cryptobacteroides sp.]